MTGRLTAEIDVDALSDNVRHVQRLAGRRRLIAVVKAEAYGHGAIPVARVVAQAGVHALGVATAVEGLALREAGIRLPILVLNGLLEEEAALAVRARLTPTIFRRSQLEALRRVGNGRPVRVHIKVDTGMGRLGMDPEEAQALIKQCAGGREIMVEGLLTHFAEADHADRPSVDQQVHRFRQVLEGLRQGGLRIAIVHAANSAALLNYPQTHFTAVRPGLLLYGYAPRAQEAGPKSRNIGVRPIMRLTTRIIHMRRVSAGVCVGYGHTFTAPHPSLIATLPVGYADGYSRGLSNRAHVLIRGHRAPVVGMLSMDLTTVDVTACGDVRVGDQVTLLGRDGKEEITAHELATHLGTIPYEVLCGLGSHATRTYQGKER